MALILLPPERGSGLFGDQTPAAFVVFQTLSLPAMRIEALFGHITNGAMNAAEPVPASSSPEVALENVVPFVVLLIKRRWDEVYQTLPGFVKSIAVNPPSRPVTSVQVEVPVYLHLPLSCVPPRKGGTPCARTDDP